MNHADAGERILLQLAAIESRIQSVTEELSATRELIQDHFKTHGAADESFLYV